LPPREQPLTIRLPQVEEPVKEEEAETEHAEFTWVFGDLFCYYS